MFDLSSVLNISKDDFVKLSKKERELVMKILSEIQVSGVSETLNSLWYEDYTEIPVSVEEFMCNPHYLGKSTRSGESIYPYWKSKYNEMFDPSINYEEIVLTGAIGVGKTRTAVCCLCYMLYKIMCLKNPQEYFKFNEGDKITIFFLNINLRLAEDVGFKTMHQYLLNSPWFMAKGTQSGRTNVLYVPPNNIGITFGSKADHALGQQIFGAFLDEVDFTKGGIKGGDVLTAQNGIMKTYTTIKERINSRFIKNGVQYGRLFLVSSKKSEHDFIEAYVNKMKNETTKMMVVDEPQWIIKPPGTFSKETFPVAVGNRSLKSRVLNSNLTDEERKAFIKQGYEILDVPVNLKQSFILDVNTALMNLAGRSVTGATSFFNFDLFSKCYVKEYKNPFITDIITTGTGDNLNIADFLMLDQIPMAVRSMPQFIHIDGALTGDKVGISSVGVSGTKSTTQYIGSREIVTEELYYKHIFSVDIQAPQGGEISLEKTRQFIYYLKSVGFNIKSVSMDGYQSADTKQMLLAQGYEAVLISLDRTPQGYMALRSAMNDERIGLIQIDLLETELIQLQRDVTTGKLDHPIGGCFTGDTKIRLVDGRSLTINELMVEQEHKTNYVYTINLDKSIIEAKPIKKVFQTKIVNKLLKVTLDNGEVITCTPEHRFMLRDGTYSMIKDIKIGSSLMPLYTKLSEKGLKGYRLCYNPFSEKWNYEHKLFCYNDTHRRGYVVHHCNYNKLDNCPINLKSIRCSKHTTIHNNTTRNYNKISKSVKMWHEKNKDSLEYKNRSNKCKQSVVNYLKSKNPNYVPNSVIKENKITEIENMYNIVWNNLTISEKNSYSVKYSRLIDPSINDRIVEKIKQNHKLGKYKKISEVIRNKRWVTNGIDNKYINKDDEIPNGYHYGRTLDPKSFEGHCKFSELPMDVQIKRRADCAKASLGKIWINNGEIERYIQKELEIPEGFYKGRIKKEYKNHKIVSIECISYSARVYDLEIQDNHNFALDAGVFVHNSKDMSDSLAGALWNATLHKQSLLDAGVLFNVALDINESVNNQQHFIDEMQQSMIYRNTSLANNKINELLEDFGSSDIISF